MTIQHDYAIMNKAAYSSNPRSILQEYGKGNFKILREDPDFLVIKDDLTGKINFVVKGTDVSNTKGKRLEDLKEDLHIVLNKPETMKRLKEMRTVAKSLIKTYGKENIIITGHSLGGYITADISNGLGVKGVAFNIGSSPKNIRPKINKNLIHFTTNDIRQGILDPLSMTSSARDFYDKRRVEPKQGVGSGIIKYHTIEHFLPDKINKEKNNNVINKEMEKVKFFNEKKGEKELAKTELELSKVNGMKITALKEEARKLGIKQAYKWKKKDLAEAKSIVKKNIRIRNKERRKEEQKEEEKEPQRSEDVMPPQNDEEEGKYSESAIKRRNDRIVETSEQTGQYNPQIDDTLDKYIPENRGSGKQTLMRKDLPSATTMSGFMDAVKTGMPNISTGDLEKAKNAYSTMKASYDRNGGNLGKTMADLATNYVPELKTLQAIGENIPYFGIKTEAEYQDLKRRMSGQPTALGGGSEAFFKSVGQLLLNPASTIRLAGDGIEYLAEETYDLFTKNKTYEAEKAARAVDIGGTGARQLNLDRTKDFVEKEKQAKRLAEIKGEKYIEDEDSKDFKPTTLKKPDRNDFYVDIGADSQMIDTKAYNEATKKYEEEKRRTLRGKDTKVDKTDFRLRDDLAQYVDSILDEQKNAKQKLSDEEIKNLIDMSSQLRNKDSNITYGNLAEIKGDIDANVDAETLESANVKVKRGAFDYLENVMLKNQSKGEADLRVEKDKEYQEAIEGGKERREMVRQQEIDHVNEQTLVQRKEVLHPGFVETATNKAELRPKIVFGNTDMQYSQSPEEVSQERETINRMLLWKAGNMTEENDPSSILYKRYRENEDLRYAKTYSMPQIQRQDNSIPQAFLRYNERIWVPVNAAKNESMPLMRQPERAEAVFDRFEDYNAQTSSMREQIANRRNIFPEPHLMGYNGPAIKQKGVKGFNRFRNNRYLTN